MLNLLFNNICNNDIKVLFLKNNNTVIMTDNHNYGILSDTIINNINIDIKSLSFSTKIITDGINILRENRSTIKGNRISKQEIDDDVYYWFLVLKDSKIIKKILIKKENVYKT